jgi:hypothetical protein
MYSSQGFMLSQVRVSNQEIVTLTVAGRTVGASVPPRSSSTGTS